MKLEYAEAYMHIVEHFGQPINKIGPYYCWRPSDADIGIELRLSTDGLCLFRINGNDGLLFLINTEKLTRNNTRHLVWSNGFSWELADGLAHAFGCVQGRVHEIA